MAEELEHKAAFDEVYSVGWPQAPRAIALRVPMTACTTGESRMSSMDRMRVSFPVFTLHCSYACH